MQDESKKNDVSIIASDFREAGPVPKFRAPKLKFRSELKKKGYKQV